MYKEVQRLEFHTRKESPVTNLLASILVCLTLHVVLMITFSTPVAGQARPGDQYPLVDVHPSYDREIIRPEGFTPRVGGLDFLSDGRLVLVTWDGGVYILNRVTVGSVGSPAVKKIADGLHEPLGLAVVDDEIYVLQKQELTHLVDHTGDEIIDEFRTVSAAWPATTNYHEFAFGLVYRDGYFYATLGTAMIPGGFPQPNQVPDRGTVIRIDPETGQYEVVAEGLRTPNGIGLGVDGEIFVTDNEGVWLPSSKLLHIVEGNFYGFRAVDPERHMELPESPPTVWIPQGAIGNSPSQPILITDDSPYAGQMLYGDVHHGGIKRVFVEKVNGYYQGAVFRFSQGHEAGVNRLVWGPDGALYVGGVGYPGGNWNHRGNIYGLERMIFNGKTTFEMLAVRAKPNGFEIEFTEPLLEPFGTNPSDYYVAQWYYQPTSGYGGPRLNYTELEVKKVERSEDRRRVMLHIDGLQEGHVVYFRLVGDFLGLSHQMLWSTEAWYTLTSIPEEEPERPRDPWVVRQSLNDRVRALLINLAEDFWVAYDGHHAGLYMAWEGEVLWYHAVYGVQRESNPQSRGKTLLEAPAQSPWFAWRNGEALDVVATFKGYRIDRNRITINYELDIGADAPIIVTEMPEVAPNPNGGLGLTRTFVTMNVPEGVELAVLNPERPAGLTGLTTTGRFDIVDEQSVLVLNANGETELTMLF